MTFSKILGTGAYLPTNVVTNADLEKRIETSDQWITDRTGIKKRHIASGSETTTSMAVSAAKQALEAAGLEPKSIDLVLVATCTPEKMFPSTACLIQQELGISPCPAFDIQAACSGYIYALSVADQFIRTGMVKRALVVGSETMSSVLDWQDRKTCILFGDGAGAVVLEASETPGILSTAISADGRQKDILYLNNQPGAFLQMQGNIVFKNAVHVLDRVATEALDRHGLKTEDLDWLVPHQANIRIIQATAQKLGLPMERVVVTVGEQGNTSGASIPMALDVAVRDGRIERGQHLLLEAFGGGLTWGTALIRY